MYRGFAFESHNNDSVVDRPISGKFSSIFQNLGLIAIASVNVNRRLTQRRCEDNGKSRVNLQAWQRAERCYIGTFSLYLERLTFCNLFIIKDISPHSRSH